MYSENPYNNNRCEFAPSPFGTPLSVSRLLFTRYARHMGMSLRSLHYDCRGQTEAYFYRSDDDLRYLFTNCFSVGEKFCDGYQGKEVPFCRALFNGSDIFERSFCQR